MEQVFKHYSLLLSWHYLMWTECSWLQITYDYRILQDEPLRWNNIVTLGSANRPLYGPTWLSAKVKGIWPCIFKEHILCICPINSCCSLACSQGFWHQGVPRASCNAWRAIHHWCDVVVWCKARRVHHPYNKLLMHSMLVPYLQTHPFQFSPFAKCSLKDLQGSLRGGIVLVV